MYPQSFSTMVGSVSKKFDPFQTPWKDKRWMEKFEAEISNLKLTVIYRLAYALRVLKTVCLSPVVIRLTSKFQNRRLVMAVGIGEAFVGRIVHYYPRINVGIVELTDGAIEFGRRNPRPR